MDTFDFYSIRLGAVASVISDSRFFFRPINKVEFRDKSAEVDFQAAHEAYKSGRWAEAAKYFCSSGAVGGETEFVRHVCHHNAAISLARDGQLRAALDLMEEHVVRNELRKTSAFNTAVILARGRDYGRALSLLERYFAEAPMGRPAERLNPLLFGLSLARELERPDLFRAWSALIETPEEQSQIRKRLGGKSKQPDVLDKSEEVRQTIKNLLSVRLPERPHLPASSSMQRLVDRAASACAERRYDEAIADAEVLTSQADTVDSSLFKANILAHAGRFGSAFAIYKRFAGEMANRPMSLWNYVRTASEVGTVSELAAALTALGASEIGNSNSAARVAADKVSELVQGTVPVSESAVAALVQPLNGANGWKDRFAERSAAFPKVLERDERKLRKQLFEWWLTPKRIKPGELDDLNLTYEKKTRSEALFETSKGMSPGAIASLINNSFADLANDVLGQYIILWAECYKERPNIDIVLVIVERITERIEYIPFSVANNIAFIYAMNGDIHAATSYLEQVGARAQGWQFWALLAVARALAGRGDPSAAAWQSISIRSHSDKVAGASLADLFLRCGIQAKAPATKIAWTEFCKELKKSNFDLQEESKGRYSALRSRALRNVGELRNEFALPEFFNSEEIDSFFSLHGFDASELITSDLDQVDQKQQVRLIEFANKLDAQPGINVISFLVGVATQLLQRGISIEITGDVFNPLEVDFAPPTAQLADIRNLVFNYSTLLAEQGDIGACFAFAQRLIDVLSTSDLLRQSIAVDDILVNLISRYLESDDPHLADGYTDVLKYYAKSFSIPENCKVVIAFDLHVLGRTQDAQEILDRCILESLPENFSVGSYVLSRRGNQGHETALNSLSERRFYEFILTARILAASPFFSSRNGLPTALSLQKKAIDAATKAGQQIYEISVLLGGAIRLLEYATDLLAKGAGEAGLIANLAEQWARYASTLQHSKAADRLYKIAAACDPSRRENFNIGTQELEPQFQALLVDLAAYGGRADGKSLGSAEAFFAAISSHLVHIGEQANRPSAELQVDASKVSCAVLGEVLRTISNDQFLVWRLEDITNCIYGIMPDEVVTEWLRASDNLTGSYNSVDVLRPLSLKIDNNELWVSHSPGRFCATLRLKMRDKGRCSISNRETGLTLVTLDDDSTQEFMRDLIIDLAQRAYKPRDEHTLTLDIYFQRLDGSVVQWELRPKVRIRGLDELPNFSFATNALTPETSYSLYGIEALPGREILIDRIRAAFQERHMTTTFFLYGIRRMGKSSILQSVRQNVCPPEALCLYINLEQAIGQDFWQFVVDEMINEVFPERMREKLSSEVRALQTRSSSFEGFVNLLPEMLAYKNKSYATIIIDEFRYFMKAKNDPAEILSQIRKCIDNPGSQISFILADRYSPRYLSTLINHEIWAQVSPMQVAQLPYSCVEQIFRAPSLAPFQFTRRALLAIYKLTNGYPYHVVQLGLKVIESRIAGPFLVADERHIMEHASEFIEDDSMFSVGFFTPDQFNAKDDLQRDVARVLFWNDFRVTLGGSDAKAGVNVVETVQPSDLFPTRALWNAAKQRLLERSIIIEEGGQIRFFSDLLLSWLRKKRQERQSIFESEDKLWSSLMSFGDLKATCGEIERNARRIDAKLTQESGRSERILGGDPGKSQMAFDEMSLPANSHSTYRVFIGSIFNLLADRDRSSRDRIVSRVPALEKVMNLTASLRHHLSHGTPSQHMTLTSVQRYFAEIDVDIDENAHPRSAEGWSLAQSDLLLRWLVVMRAAERQLS